MSWQFVLGLYFIVATASSLQRRFFAKRTRVSSEAASFVSHTFFILPLGILYALIENKLSSPNVHLVVLAALAALLQSLFNILSLKSQKHIDATQFAIIGNIYTPITVIVSAYLLKEGLTPLQMLGMALLVTGAVIVSVKGFTRETFRLDSYSLLGLVSGVALGFALVAERATIKASSIGMYFLIGWGIQALIQFFFVIPRLREVANLPRNELKEIGLMGLLRFGQFSTFLLATYLTGNVALLSSVTTFKIVFIFIASYFILKERDRLRRKLIGCTLATVGLLIT